MIAASVKPCIVKVLHIPFQNTPEPGALDLYFTFLVILPDAGAISTSAEFLLFKTDCGYTLEPVLGGSRFWSKNKKNRYTPEYSSFAIHV